MTTLDDVGRIKTVADIVVALIDVVRFARGWKRNEGPAHARILAAEAATEIVMRSELPLAFEQFAAQLQHDLAGTMEPSAWEDALTDSQHVRLIASYGRAVAEEAVDERIRMLAHAQVGAFDLRVSIGERARAERIIRELDPEDVRVLYAISKTTGAHLDGKRRDEENLRHDVLLRQRNWDLLVAAGCLRVSAAGGGGFGGAGVQTGAYVTADGYLVLRTLRTYCRARPMIFVPPGREQNEQGRTESAARTRLAATSGLADAVRDAARGCDLTYQFPNPHADPKNPPPPNGRASLWFTLPLPESRPADLARRYTGPRLPPMGHPCEDIWPTTFDSPEFAYLMLHGPHDVLRWLADDLDATWRDGRFVFSHLKGEQPFE